MLFLRYFLTNEFTYYFFLGSNIKYVESMVDTGTEIWVKSFATQWFAGLLSSAAVCIRDVFCMCVWVSFVCRWPLTVSQVGRRNEWPYITYTQCVQTKYIPQCLFCKPVEASERISVCMAMCVCAAHKMHKCICAQVCVCVCVTTCVYSTAWNNVKNACQAFAFVVSNNPSSHYTAPSLLAPLCAASWTPLSPLVLYAKLSQGLPPG